MLRKWDVVLDDVYFVNIKQTIKMLTYYEDTSVIYSSLECVNKIGKKLLQSK